MTMQKKISSYILILLVLNSCGANKINKADRFYDEWLIDSKPISTSEYEKLNLLHKNIYDVYETMLQHSLDKKPLNNLKYLVIEPSIYVSICDKIIQKENLNKTGFVYKATNKKSEIRYVLKPRSNRTDYQALYYTDKYKKIINERNRFKTASVYGFKDNRDALALFSGRIFYPIKKIMYHEPLLKISNITITTDLNEAILIASTTFSTFKYYFNYDERTESWNFEIFYQLVE